MTYGIDGDGRVDGCSYRRTVFRVFEGAGYRVMVSLCKDC
jgi:hypothetical protein